MSNKKTTIVTAKVLQAKSENAISAFRTLVSKLRATNEEAAAAKAANEQMIEMFQKENSEINLLTAQNEKIIQNVENILSV